MNKTLCVEIFAFIFELFIIKYTYICHEYVTIHLRRVVPSPPVLQLAEQGEAEEPVPTKRLSVCDANNSRLEYEFV